MGNPITPTGEFFPAPIKTPLYNDETALKKGELTRPWIHWFQLTSGAAKSIQQNPPTGKGLSLGVVISISPYNVNKI